LALCDVLLGNVCLAVGPLLVRVAGETDDVGPLSAAFWRWTLAIPALLLLMRFARPREPRAPPTLLLGMAAVGPDERQGADREAQRGQAHWNG
jgi:drug/metabolite transporter (DMT)-like permease